MTIPFRNMSQREADKEPFSPYAQFCQSLYGFWVFNKETGDKWSKSELFIAYSDNPEELKQISEHKHTDFKFVNKDDWK